MIPSNIIEAKQNLRLLKEPLDEEDKKIIWSSMKTKEDWILVYQKDDGNIYQHKTNKEYFKLFEQGKFFPTYYTTKLVQTTLFNPFTQ